MCGVAGSRWPGASDRSQSQRRRLGIRRAQAAPVPRGRRLGQRAEDHRRPSTRRWRRRSTRSPACNPSTFSAIPLLARTQWSETVQPDRGGMPKDAYIQAVRWTFFETLGIRLLAGRNLSRGDHARPPPVAVINEMMARQVFGDPQSNRPAFSVADGTASKRARRSRRHRQRHQVFEPGARAAADPVPSLGAASRHGHDVRGANGGRAVGTGTTRAGRRRTCCAGGRGAEPQDAKSADR